jgi:ribosome-binding factor A
VLNTDESERTLKKLISSASFIKSELGRRLKMKYIPNLKFKLDESIEYGRKIDGILDGLDSERSSIEDDEDLF